MRLLRLKRYLWTSWLLIWLIPATSAGEEEYQRVQVTAPYIEMHTGPGRSYPIVYVVERMEWVEVRKRRTDWFQVYTRRGRSGWVSLEQMRQTQTADGERLKLVGYTQDDFRNREWEFGFYGGDMEGATLLGLYGGYSFNENLSAELSLSQALGDFSSEYLFDVNLLSQPFPEWTYSPFFTLGGGVIRTEPKSTLVQAEDRTDTTAHVGAGLRVYLTRRFFLRGEFRHYTAFTSREDNEEFDQWKIGLGFFF
ncbi:MAG: outer membrane beta-barrel protein [Candidatus Thiodiazotropha endolucinida]|uniref:Outer membrane beta-barrel protein n=1 Tax=Candidatus Thiodiazotropha taylori TaxID=2792791 RepID=A0A9E4NID0_9GAMM|nr:outer membrane beta-barrel protein [Candidatus Thiodiazotropha endolucinida]MCG7977300.1 outer membrane beta-barrel protein [Candidatus Thiodiazotropha taylori]MCG7863632.1 outer membrane beta-barrel protein [Candidatus Thiodiazotropha endolucinida]MCG8045510.1 outer membrane beta-barrel protein [Candidatus Thiodiazotropha taylori]MCG8059715.1 outer membrane beta-barrel protein [Candidatus Thiodiazotropha taylori]MCG8063645.1 outer membrane beta-barrel protein [Candidatus Thiodiazotropha ta